MKFLKITLQTFVVALLPFNASAQVWLTNGLVAYYPFNGNANDVSGNGNNGTVNGSILRNDRLGSPASAYHFNGATSYIELTDIDLLTDFSISSWVSPEQYKVSIVGKYLTPAAYEMLINSEGYLYAHTREDIHPDSTLVSTNQPIPLNRWSAVSFVFDSTNRIGRIYVNGELIQSGPMTNSQDNVYPTRIGRSVWGGNAFQGAIDDVRIYNRALSSNEVAQLYAIESGAVINLRKAVYLDSANLLPGRSYQVQYSTTLTNWTNSGAPFTATNTAWRSTNYWDVEDWNQLFFRLQSP